VHIPDDGLGIKAKLLDFDPRIHHSVDDKSIDGWDDQYTTICVCLY